MFGVLQEGLLEMFGTLVALLPTRCVRLLEDLSAEPNDMDETVIIFWSARCGLHW